MTSLVYKRVKKLGEILYKIAFPDDPLCAHRIVRYFLVALIVLIFAMQLFLNASRNILNVLICFGEKCLEAFFA